jgi:tetratricopeptide (TPR) repeat protein
MVEARLGEVKTCRRNIQEALQLVPSIRSPVADSDVHLFVGWSYLDLGENRQAVEYARLGVVKALSADNMECACSAFACLGFGHLRIDQIGEAIRAFEEAVRRSKISGAEEIALLGQMGLGLAQFLTGRPEAIQETENALAHAREIGEEYVGALLSQTLGEMYLARGEVQDSIARLTDALQFYRRHQMRPYLSRTLELLADAFERQGEREKANQARSDREALQGPNHSATGE